MSLYRGNPNINFQELIDAFDNDNDDDTNLKLKFDEAQKQFEEMIKQNEKERRKIIDSLPEIKQNNTALLNSSIEEERKRKQSILENINEIQKQLDYDRRLKIHDDNLRPRLKILRDEEDLRNINKGGRKTRKIRKTKKTRGKKSRTKRNKRKI